MTLRRILDDGTLEGTTGAAVPPETQGFKAVSATEPNTTGWATHDLWLDLSELDDETAPTIRVWTGSEFWPAPAGAPVLGTLLLSDDFTGTDGAVWNASKWGLGRAPVMGTGGGATLLSGAGVLAASNYGNFAGESMISRKALITDAADVNIEFSFKFDTTTSYLFVHARHGTSTLDREDGYALSIDRVADEWYISELTAYSSVLLGSVQSFTFDTDVWYRCRFRAVGTALKGKVWAAASAEPGTWGSEVTDGTYSSAGKTGLSVAGGPTSSLARRVFIDDLVIRAS